MDKIKNNYCKTYKQKKIYFKNIKYRTKYKI